MEQSAEVPEQETSGLAGGLRDIARSGQTAGHGPGLEQLSWLSGIYGHIRTGEKGFGDGEPEPRLVCGQPRVQAGDEKGDGRSRGGVGSLCRIATGGGADR